MNLISMQNDMFRVKVELVVPSFSFDAFTGWNLPFFMREKLSFSHKMRLKKSHNLIN